AAPSIVTKARFCCRHATVHWKVAPGILVSAVWLPARLRCAPRPGQMHAGIYATYFTIGDFRAFALLRAAAKGGPVSHAIAVAEPEITGELAVRSRNGGAMPGRLLRALWVATQRICLAALLMLGAGVAANAACDQTTNSTSGVTVNFTSVGQVYRLCLTVGTASAPADDSV